MKAKSILVITFALIVSATFANDVNNNKFVVIRGQKSGIFKVIFEGEEKVKATVNVFDKKGTLVYSQNVQGENGFILPMNFTGLKSGDYLIEMKNGQNTWTQTVNHSRATYTSTVSRADRNSTIQHVFVSKLKEDGKYLLSVSKTGGESVAIDIFNSNDELVYTERRKADGDFAVVYDMKKTSGVKFEITGKAGYSKVIKK